jgi:hypothetical protein
MKPQPTMSRTSMNHFPAAWPPTIAVLALTMVVPFGPGCGKSTGSRVFGTVAFDGKPVPGGKIYFTPDAEKGNSGPSGFADITNGRYDTAATGGRNVQPGPTILAVDGVEPLDESEQTPDVTQRPLFQTHTESLEVPPTELQHDIAVPAAAKPVSAGRGI